MTRSPNLVLAGVGKAGTTSLFAYLGQHPAVFRPPVKETRYFLPLSESEEGDAHLAPFGDYLRNFANATDERFVMEATPHYFHGGRRLVDGIKATLPDPRVIITLREPVARLWSIYRFAKSMLLLPTHLNFDEYVETAMQIHAAGVRQTVDNRPYWTGVSGSMYSHFICDWIDTFGRDRLRIVFFEDLVANPSKVVADTCTWLGIDGSPVRAFDFSPENQSQPFRSRSLQRIALFANKEGLLRNHPAVKRPLRRLYYAANRGPSYGAIPADRATELDVLFAGPNRDLALLLRTKGYSAQPAWLRSAHA
jgi:hypothetical protein